MPITGGPVWPCAISPTPRPPPPACSILQGNIFINQYLIIKDVGRGAHGMVKLVYNTQDNMLYAMKVRHSL